MEVEVKRRGLAPTDRVGVYHGVVHTASVLSRAMRLYASAYTVLGHLRNPLSGLYVFWGPIMACSCDFELF